MWICKTSCTHVREKYFEEPPAKPDFRWDILHDEKKKNTFSGTPTVNIRTEEKKATSSCLARFALKKTAVETLKKHNFSDRRRLHRFLNSRYSRRNDTGKDRARHISTEEVMRYRHNIEIHKRKKSEKQLRGSSRTRKRRRRVKGGSR